jgi:thiol-disulfide isomerase/thioredoxin
MSTRRLLLTAVAVAVVATACSSGGPPPTTTPLVLTSPHATNATTTPLLPQSRFALPDFTPDTFRQLLAQLRSAHTPVVVNFWAAWCGPCLQEAPHLAAVARRLGTRVQFLGVDLQDRRRNAQVFIRDHGWPYPSVSDPAGEIKASFGFQGQPVTVFFDPNGRQVSFTQPFAGPVDHWSGPIPLGRLSSLAERIAAG